MFLDSFAWAKSVFEVENKRVKTRKGKNKIRDIVTFLKRLAEASVHCGTFASDRKEKSLGRRIGPYDGTWAFCDCIHTSRSLRALSARAFFRSRPLGAFSIGGKRPKLTFMG